MIPLDPRPLLAALVLAIAAAAGGYFKGRSDGTRLAGLEHARLAGEADAEAQRLERARQSRADEAGQMAAARESRLRADAADAAGAVRGLRDELAAVRAGSQSCTAEAERAATRGELLEQCAAAYQELAGAADRHASDVRMLLDAWPR